MFAKRREAGLDVPKRKAGVDETVASGGVLVLLGVTAGEPDACATEESFSSPTRRLLPSLGDGVSAAPLGVDGLLFPSPKPLENDTLFLVGDPKADERYRGREEPPPW